MYFDKNKFTLIGRRKRKGAKNIAQTKSVVERKVFKKKQTGENEKQAKRKAMAF